MEGLEIGLFVGGILVTLTMIILIIKSIMKLKRPKRAWEEDESNNFIEQTQKSSDEKDGDGKGNRPKIFMREHHFHLPLSYEKIQNQKPWKHRAVPTVSVTQHSPTSASAPTNLLPSSSAAKHHGVLNQRRRSITNQMMADLHKHGKHVMYSSFHSGAESGGDSGSEYHLGPNFSDDGSLTASSVEHNSADDGKAHYLDSNVHGIKKRVTRTRRLGRKTHHSPVKPSFKKTGKLFFEAEYIRHERKLVLNIIKCSELKMKTDIHHSNTFVRAYLVPGKIQRQQTKIRRETYEPIFNESLVFTDLDQVQLQRHKLRLKVYNHSKLKKHDLIGEVDIALITLNTDAKETFDADLFVKKSENANASMMISIRHEAALSKLQVNIEEAKNLPKAHLTGLNPDPYVIVKLYKGDSCEKKETLHLRNTRAPKFHETFQFQLATDFEYPLSVFSLVVTIANKVLIGRDEVLGHVIFSLDSPQHSAITHWRNVQTEPHKTHSRWHSLIDPEDV
ncbi:synaptotagmin-7-like [Clytia hemisphaerica]|uniref:C2 domain-containing protein n=1 Tax=Clytia hemisphaerica TaxID=252671 RepID=A0A7M5UQN1_9CNID|eukprot:TCONS_00061922-protein